MFGPNRCCITLGRFPRKVKGSTEVVTGNEIQLFLVYYNEKSIPKEKTGSSLEGNTIEVNEKACGILAEG